MEIDGRRRDLTHLIRRELGKMAALIDDPNELGKIVYQFLWPRDHFERFHFTPFQTSNNGAEHKNATPKNVRKTPLPESEKTLFKSNYEKIFYKNKLSFKQS